MTDLRKMSNEAINERIQLADASQKQLCAKIARSEDGDFGLGLFDVLQEMYNAGYARGAAPSEGMKADSNLSSEQMTQTSAEPQYEPINPAGGSWLDWPEESFDLDPNCKCMQLENHSFCPVHGTHRDITAYRLKHPQWFKLIEPAAPSLEECARKMAEAYGWGWEHMSDAAKLTFTKMAKAALDTLQAHFGEP